LVGAPATAIIPINELKLGVLREVEGPLEHIFQARQSAATL
jgi:hypothetical protein